MAEIVFSNGKVRISRVLESKTSDNTGFVVNVEREVGDCKFKSVCAGYHGTAMMIHGTPLLYCDTCGVGCPLYSFFELKLANLGGNN